MPAELQEWFSVEQLEARSGGHISKWTWRRWAQTGKVASAKVSTRLLISRAEYERVMAEATRPRKGDAERIQPTSESPALERVAARDAS